MGHGNVVSGRWDIPVYRSGGFCCRTVLRPRFAHPQDDITPAVSFVSRCRATCPGDRRQKVTASSVRDYFGEDVVIDVSACDYGADAFTLQSRLFFHRGG